MTPRLETSRLVLRQFAPTDWDAINAMLSDPETTRYMHFANWSEDRRREWFDRCVANGQQPDADAINWVIVRKDTGSVIGWFGIGASSEPAVTYDISFGYLIDRAHWNQGYMTEALRAVLAYEFETLGAPQLSATCDVANPASARVMEKAGMRRERTVYDADFEGNRAHRHHYTITKGEYEARR
ncbi:MAG: GNAT family N-acetyltransferase [Chloroflexota bacterium]|nr:GNAT family N-acetyltransferase [Chloroflexota bacterium]